MGILVDLMGGITVKVTSDFSAVPSAANYLNMVRTRAGLSNTTATTQKEMSIAIENERMLNEIFFLFSPEVSDCGRLHLQYQNKPLLFNHLK